MSKVINKNNKCLHCDKELFRGRSDKKFCDNSCRSSYNNALKLKKVKSMQELLANGKLKGYISEKINQIQQDIDRVRHQRREKGNNSNSDVSLDIETLRLNEDIRAAKKIFANLEIISSDM